MDSIDVLCHYKSILSLTGEAAFFNSRYTRLDPTTSLHKSILISANHLKSQVFHYDKCRDGCTDSTQEVYVSSSGDKLPIVIDTGASNSISPTATDFTGTIRRSSLQSLKQVNGTTPVCGEGEVLWDIEDYYGTRRSVITDAYFVPTATIRLFSPQVYIGTDSTANMTLDRSGLQLTLKCGTILHFPINLSNNLPFMLTENSLNKGRKPKRKSNLQLSTPDHKPPKKQLNLKMSTFGSGVYSSGASIYNNLIEHSVLQRSNQNLDPAQHELMKWHS